MCHRTQRTTVLEKLTVAQEVKKFITFCGIRTFSTAINTKFLKRGVQFLQNVWCNDITGDFNPYPTAFPYGNGMVLHFYQQQESSTTKTVHKVINRGLKAYV